jgi:PadR family transcriptional regulator PadR
MLHIDAALSEVTVPVVEREAEDKGERQRLAAGAFPHDFLTPWLLLLIRNWSMHGYQLMQTMALFGLAACDPATVYRTLRRLEKDGLINSDWEPGDAGPAKRVYSLTEAGDEFLQSWASALRQHQDILDRFFNLYAGAKGEGS